MKMFALLCCSSSPVRGFVPIFLTVLLLASCSEQREGKSEKRSNPIEEKEPEMDTLVSPSIVNHHDTLIYNAYDLVQFKSRKQTSNSGSARVHDWFYKPTYEGFYYQFMLFYPGPASINEYDYFKGLSVIVYRPGKEIGHFHNDDDMLICIKSRLNDPDLGEFDIVGKNREEVTELFGSGFTSTGDLMVYQVENKLLIIRITDDTVQWFRYTVIKNGFNVRDVLLEPF